MARENGGVFRQWVKVLCLCIILQGFFFPGERPDQGVKPQSSLPGIHFALGLMRPVPARAEGPVAVAGEYGPLQKDQPVGSGVSLDGSQSSHEEGATLQYEWFGPFPRVTGPNPVVVVPEGTYTISLSVNDGIIRSEIDEAVITVEPCFDVIVRAKRSVAQPYWQHISGAERYDVYRTDEDDPFSFVKVAEIDPAYTTYYDTSVQNEKTYLYVIGALVEGSWCFSAVESARPTVLRTMGTVNYTPVIYTPPVTNGTAGIMYSFTIKAADPNCDPLSYTLTSFPPDMWIDQSNGQITWLPDATGEYHVTALANDGKGGTDTLSWTIVVDGIPPVNRIPTADAGGPYCGEVNEPIAFDGTGSLDPDNDPLTFHWEFGDGSTGSGICPSHTYPAPGTYTVTLTVFDGRGGESSDSTTVDVVQCRPPSVSLSADVAAVLPGGPCTLVWTSMNARSVVIDSGIGTVDTSGTVTVHPQTTTTYTATAQGDCGAATASVTVIVHQPPNVSITASPLSIVAGQTSQLSWTSANADTVGIDQGIGTVLQAGSLPVSPTATTSYTITATGPGGTASSSVTVTVYQPPRVSISVQPQSIIEGESATLTWTSQHADTALLDNGIGPVDVSGSLAVSPSQTTTYTITVQGPGGTSSADATVTVLHEPTVTITASPNPIEAGQTTTLTWSSTNADSASIDQGIGTVGVSGSMQVSPALTTIYTIAASGPGGTATATVTVEVRQSGQQRRPLAYIPNGREDDVSVIDIQEYAVIDRVPVGCEPYGVAVSPDGDQVYVTSTESGISIIDAATHTVTGQIPVYADTLAISPGGALLYALSLWEDILYRVDTSSGEVTGAMDTGPMPHGIAVNNEGTRIYITSLVDGTVKVVDSSTMSIIASIRVTDPGDSIWDVEVSNDGSKIYAVSARSCRLSVIDSQTNIVIQTREYLEMEAQECHLALSPDGDRVALSDISSANIPQTIFIIDSRSLDILNVFPAMWPSDLDFTADGSLLCVPDAWFGEVVVFNDMNNPAGTVGQDFDGPCAAGHFIAEHKDRVSGRVLADGEGVEGVRVTLSNMRITKCFSTNAQGQYFFYVPAGQYGVSFSEDECLVSDQSFDVLVSDTEVVVSDVEVLVSARIWSEAYAVVSGQPVVLNWSTVKAGSVSIDHGIGDVGPGGSLSVYPDETTTYTVTAADSQGRTVTDRVTVTVYRPPTVSITADPQAVIQGGEVTLSWTSSDADTLRLEFEDYSFPVEPAGTLTEIPEETCTVTITATGPGGTATDSVTITVYVPPMVTVAANPAAIYVGQSSELSWTSVDAESVRIDNGIGEVELNGSLRVSPGQTTTYTVTAAGPGGVRTAWATVTVNSIIGISIDLPVSGAVVNRPDILVRGTVSNAYENETGITVNGTPAMVHQGRFFANHVPLVDGENTINVHAEDIQGNVLDRSILVTANTTQPCITLSSIDLLGIAPLDTILRVDSLFTPDGLTFTDTGPGVIRYLAGDEVHERTAGISNPGVYYITARANYEGSVFTDTIGVAVYDQNALDAMLRQKWEAMRTALLSNEIEAAAEDISSRTQSNYQDIFTSLTPGHRADLAAELEDIQIIKMRGVSVEYDIRTTRDGRLCSFLLLFELDEDGRWKIASF